MQTRASAKSALTSAFQAVPTNKAPVKLRDPQQAVPTNVRVQFPAHEVQDDYMPSGDGAGRGFPSAIAPGVVHGGVRRARVRNQRKAGTDRRLGQVHRPRRPRTGSAPAPARQPQAGRQKGVGRLTARPQDAGASAGRITPRAWGERLSPPPRPNLRRQSTTTACFFYLESILC